MDNKIQVMERLRSIPLLRVLLLLEITKIITVQVSNACGTGNSRTFNVDVNTFAAVDAGPPNVSMCSGTQLTLINILTGNANTVTWKWKLWQWNNYWWPLPYTLYIYSEPFYLGTVTLTVITNESSR